MVELPQHNPESMPGSWSSEVRRNLAWWVWTKASSTASSWLKKTVVPKVSTARLKIKRSLNCQERSSSCHRRVRMPAHTQHNWRVLNTQKALHVSSKGFSANSTVFWSLWTKEPNTGKGPIPREQIRKHSWKSAKTKDELFKFLSDVLVNATSMSSYSYRQ